MNAGLAGVVSEPKTFPHIPRRGDGDERIFPDPLCVKPEGQPRHQRQNNESNQQRVLPQRSDDRIKYPLKSWGHWLGYL